MCIDQRVHVMGEPRVHALLKPSIENPKDSIIMEIIKNDSLTCIKRNYDGDFVNQRNEHLH